MAAAARWRAGARRFCCTFSVRPGPRPLPLLVFLHGYGERRRAARPVAGDVWVHHAELVRAQRAPEQPVWLSAGELARSQRRAFVKALGLVEHGERVWADDGENHVGCARVAYGD